MHARVLASLLVAVPALLLVGCAGRGVHRLDVADAIAPGRAVADSTTAASQVQATRAARAIVPGDLLDVTVFAAPELSRIVRVGSDGTISLPLLGPLQAMGRSPHELEIAVQDTLRRTYMRDPKVLVEVKEAAAQPVYVVGEVIQPGAFVPSGEDRLTVLRAVAVAKGMKPTAAQERVIVLRPQPNADPLQIRINVGEVVKGRVPDFSLLPNDVVYVPKNSERAVALGVVNALLRVVTLRAVF
jgi:polysaccharide biosynthesis/export protein